MLNSGEGKKNNSKKNWSYNNLSFLCEWKP